MRKYFYAGLLAVGLATAVFCDGCGGKSDTKDLAPEKKPESSSSALETAGGTEETPSQSEITDAQEPEGSQTEAVEENAAEGEKEEPVKEVLGTIAPVEEETYRFGGMTITVPDNWNGHYVAETDEGGCSFYQKKGDGQAGAFVCGFGCTDEYRNYGAGETLLAYTDKGQMYYLYEPTDVPYDPQNEAEAKEYVMLADGIDTIIKKLSFSSDAVSFDVGEYLIPVSSVTVLDEEVLLNFTDKELKTARNEIYARHGRKFLNRYLQSYFNSRSWYEGTTEPEKFDESVLNETEKTNLKLISDYEAKRKAQYPYPQKVKMGQTASVDLNGDGTPENVSCEITLKGQWDYEGKLMVDGTTYKLSDYIGFDTPDVEQFYITDLSSEDQELEIAVLDYGPSDDPVTHFFRYDGQIRYIGMISGFPFEGVNEGFNGFCPFFSTVSSRARIDLIETAFTIASWWYDPYGHTLNERYYAREMLCPNAHKLLTDLKVYEQLYDESPVITIPAQDEVYFTEAGEDWLFVRGKDGTGGYIKVGKEYAGDSEYGPTYLLYPAQIPSREVFSDLYYFD